MKQQGGFSLIEGIIFVVVVGIACGVLAFMIDQVAFSGSKDEIYATTIALAEGRLEYIQGLPFSSVASVARAPVAAPFDSFDSEITSEYVSGPSDLDTVVAGPTNYKKATVILYAPTWTGATVTLRTIKVART